MYLEEKYPEHPLLPSDLQKKAINFQAANIVSSSIQPLHKLAVVKFAEGEINSEEKLSWVGHFIKKGFTALEGILKGYTGRYATGNEVSLAEFPLLYKLNEAYSELPAFLDAMIEKQPDAPI